MLGFVRHFVPHRGLPIGVDFGARHVRVAQVAHDGNDLRLVHARTFDTPELTDTSDTADFLARCLRDVLRSGGFLGRQVALSIAPSVLQVRHVRVGKAADPNDVALQARDLTLSQLGGASEDWHIRHVVAGDVCGEQNPEQEAVVFATPQDTIARMLDAANHARAEVVGVQVQPRMITQTFGQLLRRAADNDAVNLFVDLGHSGTRAIVAAPIDVKFVRAMPLNVAQAHDRIVRAMKMSADQVATLRKLTISQQVGRTHELPATADTATPEQLELQRLTEQEAQRFAEELDLCRRYYEATFPSQPITRLIFVGGGAKDRLLCAAIAQAMTLPAQIGDPLVRFNRSTIPALPCLDRRDPQPEWAVAIGLSLLGRSVAVAA